MGRIYLTPRFMTDKEKNTKYTAINVNIYRKKKSFFPWIRLYKYTDINQKNRKSIGIGVLKKNAKIK